MSVERPLERMFHPPGVVFASGDRGPLRCAVTACSERGQRQKAEGDHRLETGIRLQGPRVFLEQA